MAGLQHPHVVTVFGLGEDEYGRRDPRVRCLSKSLRWASGAGIWLNGLTLLTYWMRQSAHNPWKALAWLAPGLAAGVVRTLFAAQRQNASSPPVPDSTPIPAARASVRHASLRRRSSALWPVAGAAVAFVLTAAVLVLWRGLPGLVLVPFVGVPAAALGLLVGHAIGEPE